MKNKPPLEAEEPRLHVRAREVGAVLDATVLLPFNIWFAWATMLVQVGTTSKEAGSPL